MSSEPSAGQETLLAIPMGNFSHKGGRNLFLEEAGNSACSCLNNYLQRRPELEMGPKPGSYECLCFTFLYIGVTRALAEFPGKTNHIRSSSLPSPPFFYFAVSLLIVFNSRTLILDFYEPKYFCSE